MNLLLIDDDGEDRRVMSEYLHGIPDLDISIDESDDFQSGIGKLTGGSYDCAIIDYRLPERDGLELIEQARSAVNGLIPFIVVTGMGDELLAVEAIKRGAADYIPKNRISSRVFARSIKNVLRTHQLEERARAVSEKLVESEKKYREIVEKVSDLIFQLDPEGRFVFVNPAVKFIGYDPSDMLGRHIGDFLTAKDKEKIIPQIATREVGPLATSNLPVEFKVNEASTLADVLGHINLHIDASGLWNVPEEEVLRKNPGKQFLGTLCVGRKLT